MPKRRLSERAREPGYYEVNEESDSVSESELMDYYPSTTKRSRRSIIDDEDDDEGTESAMAAQSAEIPRKGISASTRLALLTVRTAANKTTRLAISEEILSRIPAYEAKLGKAAAQRSNSSQRLQIRDDAKRDEETLLHVFDYLHGGTIETSSHPPTEQSLIDLLHLSDLASDLQLPLLCLVAAESITNSDDQNLSIETFISFAQSCYDPRQNYVVDSQGPIEQWIKRFMAARLHVLLDGGWDGTIRQGGGVLAGQLMEVMADELKGRARAARESKVPVRTEEGREVKGGDA